MRIEQSREAGIFNLSPISKAIIGLGVLGAGVLIAGKIEDSHHDIVCSDPVSYTVQQGDNAWRIAEHVQKDGGVENGDVTDYIIAHNGGEDAFEPALQVGQVITKPTECHN